MTNDRRSFHHLLAIAVVVAAALSVPLTAYVATHYVGRPAPRWYVRLVKSPVGRLVFPAKGSAHAPHTSSLHAP